MQSLIEKLKTVDKKVWIGVGIGAAVLIILIIALVIGSGDKPAGNHGGSQSGTQLGSESENDSSEIFGSEGLGTEVLGTEMGTEVGTEMGTEITGSETENGNGGQNNGGQSNGNSGNGNSGNGNSGNGSSNNNAGPVTSEKPDDVNGVEQNTVTTKPNGEEILGAGTKDEPYQEIPNYDANTKIMTVETVSVPAGGTLYYSIHKIGAKWLTIEDEDAYVIESDGKTRHDAQDGKVAFTVENAMDNEYVLLQIGNKGKESKVFTLKFVDITGSYEKPENITSLNGKKSLAKGDEDGYYYKYKATKTGKIRFYIDYTEESDINVMNLTTSAVRSFASDDTGAEYIELDVKAGDEVLIQICAIPDKRYKFPATTITWRGEYA